MANSTSISISPSPKRLFMDSKPEAVPNIIIGDISISDGTRDASLGANVGVCKSAERSESAMDDGEEAWSMNGEVVMVDGGDVEVLVVLFVSRTARSQSSVLV